MKQAIDLVHSSTTESIDSFRSKAKRQRAHTVPGTMIAPVRAGIVQEMKAGRNSAQTAKANNATQVLCVELYCRAKFFALDQKVRELEEILYRRAA